MTDGEFAFLARLVHDRTGIMVRAEKRQMLRSRLDRRIRALGLTGYGAYCDLLGADAGEAELGEMVNAVTTNLTSFFREKHHFDHLGDQGIRTALASLQQEGVRRLRLWSAGCSTGQEPYSIAMTLLARVAGLDRWDARILATDIDSDVLATAAQGDYPADRADGLPDEYRRRFTDRHRDGSISVSDGVRGLVTFKQLNLMETWPVKGPFQAIFCRNVVIYFDKPTQARLFDRFADLLPIGGWLYIGHSESLFKVTDRFRLVGSTIYQRVA